MRGTWYCVLPAEGHIRVLVWNREKSGLRGLGGVFIHLAWQSVTKAISFYMERLSYSQQCWIRCLWIKTLVQNCTWLVEPLVSVWCCRYLPVPQLIEQRWVMHRTCPQHTSLWCQDLAKAAIVQSWANIRVVGYIAETWAWLYWALTAFTHFLWLYLLKPVLITVEMMRGPLKGFWLHFPCTFFTLN